MNNAIDESMHFAGENHQLFYSTRPSGSIVASVCFDIAPAGFLYPEGSGPSGSETRVVSAIGTSHDQAFTSLAMRVRDAHPEKIDINPKNALSSDGVYPFGDTGGL